eukprot:scaffold34672_cov59-Phaeocystis_antarctica.AAC.2
MSDISENLTSCFIASAAVSLSVSCAISAAAAADSSRRAAFSTASAFSAASAARCNLDTSATLRLGGDGSARWPNMSLLPPMAQHGVLLNQRNQNLLVCNRVSELRAEMREEITSGDPKGTAGVRTKASAGV